MLSGRTGSKLFGTTVLVAAVAAGCLGVPDMATETADGSALSADGRRMRLIYRNRGWIEGREAYELYSKIPYVSSGSVTIMGLRLALPTRWADNTPVSLFTFDTRWWNDADMGLAIYHRAEGTNGNWVPIRCTTAGVVAGGTDLQYFNASQALIDLQAGELELVPVAGAGVGATPSNTGFERDEQDSRRYEDSGRDTRTPANVTVSTFAQCGITEANPEFSAFVFPYSVGYWGDRFDYDFAALCDGDPCPAYRGDPNEPRRTNNGVIPNNNGGIVNTDPYRTAWDVTDDALWQCGRTNVVGAGNVTSARVEIRGRHVRTSELEATIKKVGGLTNLNLFSTNSGLYFPISRTVATSNELFAGTWELCLRDTQRGEIGRVDGWSIILDQAGAGGGVQGAVTAVTAGASRSDSIAAAESDWYSISLTAGQTLTVETTGQCSESSSFDPFLSMHSTLPVTRPSGGTCPSRGDATWTAGSYLECQDQQEASTTGTATGNCARIAEAAPSTGTYYVRVFGYQSTSAGTYTVSFQVR